MRCEMHAPHRRGYNTPESTDAQTQDPEGKARLSLRIPGNGHFSIALYFSFWVSHHGQMSHCT